MSSAERPDVFISYSSLDRRFAEHVEASLAPLDVWRDKTRIEADWSREIANALARSERVCLIWSAGAAASRPVAHEWMTARALGIAIDVLALPDAPPLPHPLKNVEWCAGSDPIKAAAWIRQRIDHGIRPTYDYTILPGRSHIPFLPNRQFVGRSEDLLDLYLTVVSGINQIGRTIVGLTGLPGIGKTQLAVEFAYRFAYAFDAVLWMQGENPLDWRAQVARIGRHEFDATPVDATLDDASAIHRLRDVLSSPSRRVLIVIDNVHDPATLHRDSTLGPDVPHTFLTLGASVLFTSRRSLRLGAVTTRLVGRLSDSSAISLLSASRVPATADEGAAAREICVILGGLPLGIVLANGFLRKYSEVPFRSYADELRHRIVETLDLADVKNEELATRHDVAVSTMLDGHLQLLADDERRLLALTALFPESSFVSRPRLRLFFEGARSHSILVRPFDRSAATLEDLNLVEAFAENATLRLHPVVREFVVNATTNVSELKLQAAHNLRSAYSSAESLATEHERRGLAAVAEDTAIGAEWARAGGEDSTELRALSQVLNRELVHVERTHGAPADRATFFRQLHWRSIQTDLAALGETLADVLAKSSSAYFILRTIAPTDDPALVRATVGPLEDPDLSSIRGIRALASQNIVVTLDWSSAVVWDLRRLQPLHRLKHPGREYLHAAMITPDGREIWTADSAGRVMRWDARSGERISELSIVLEGDAYAAFELRDVAFTADCSLLVAAYDNRNQKRFEGTDIDNGTAIVARWSLPDGTPQPPLVLDTPWLNAVAVDNTARRAAMGGPANGTVAIWDLDDRVRVRVYEGYSSRHAVQRPSALAFDARGDVVVATINETLLSWDVSSGRLLREDNHYNSVSDMVIRSDGAMIASCARGAIRIGDVRGQSPVRELRQSSPSAVAFVEDTGLLLSGASLGTLTLWDLQAPAPRDAAVHSHSIRRLAFSDAGTSLYSACGVHLIHWNVADGASTPIVAFPPLVGPVLGDREHPTIDPFGRFTRKDVVNESGAVHLNFLGQPVPDKGIVSLTTWPTVTDVDVDPTGATALVSTVYGATLYLSDGHPALWGKHSDSPVVGCAFAGDGHAIVGHLSGRVIIRQTIPGARTWRFETGYKIAGLVASRRASRAMLVGDGPITVVDLVARRAIMAVEYRIHPEERRRLSGADDWAQRPLAAAMSGNGRIAVVSLGLPGLVQIDVESRTMHSLGRHGRVTAIALSDDGTLALLGGVGGWASLLDTETGESIAHVSIDEGVSTLALDGNTFAVGDLRGRVAIGAINGIPARAAGVRQTFGAARLGEEGVWSIEPTLGAPSKRSRQRGGRT